VDGRINGPQGAQGGLEGTTARNHHRLVSGRLVELGGLVNLRLEPGETVVALSCAGGGYGPPSDRDPAQGQHDGHEGYVSRGRAETIYRVVFDRQQEIDVSATAQLRGRPPVGDAITY